MEDRNRAVQRESGDEGGRRGIREKLERMGVKGEPELVAERSKREGTKHKDKVEVMERRELSDKRQSGNKRR